MADQKEQPSYMDENLTEREKQGGRTRQPSSAEPAEGADAEQPYPGEEHRDRKHFERPDEFGDGDRRS